jgi:hypothetical protein
MVYMFLYVVSRRKGVAEQGAGERVLAGWRGNKGRILKNLHFEDLHNFVT